MEGKREEAKRGEGGGNAPFIMALGRKIPTTPTETQTTAASRHLLPGLGPQTH